MAIELWPDFDQPDLLVINSLLLPPHQTLPASVTYTLPPNARLHTVAQFDQNQQSLSDQVSYTQKGDTVVVDAQYSGLRLEYYLPYDTEGDTHKINFVWQSAFTADLLQISIQQPRHAENFILNTDVMESRETDNGLSYYILPPRSINQGEAIALSFSYDLPENQLSLPSLADPAAQQPQEFSITNNLLNNLPFVGLGLILLFISFVFLRQGWQESRGSRTPQPKQTCANCQSINRGQDKFCRQCGEPLGS